MQNEQGGDGPPPGYDGSSARADQHDGAAGRSAAGRSAPDGGSQTGPAVSDDGPGRAPEAGAAADPYGFGAPGQPGGYPPPPPPPGQYGPYGQPGGAAGQPGGYGMPGGYPLPGQYGPGGYAPAPGHGYGQPGSYASARPATESGPAPEPAQHLYGQAGEYGEPGWGESGQPDGYGSGAYGPPPPDGGYRTAGGGYGTAESSFGSAGGGYGAAGGGWAGYGAPGDFIQQQPRRRLTGLVAYIAVAAVAAAAGAGTVLLADHGSNSSNAAASPGNSVPNGTNGLGGSGGLSPASPSPHPKSPVSGAALQAVKNAVQPGIVDITSNLRYQGGTAAATGMVISSSGLVLTNNHVIIGTTGLVARVVATGQHFTARFVGYDKADDVAVIQLENASNLKTVPLGDSSTVKIGNGVVALGNAGGTGSTTIVTGGITGLDQTITASDNGSSTSERLTNMLRTDANIQPGDSGGPLASTSGKVIGMDTAAATGAFGGLGQQQNVGFAIPINRAMRIARQIISGHSSSSVQIGAAGFLGVLVPANKASNTASPAQQRRLQIAGNSSATGGLQVPPSGAGCIPNDRSAGVPAKVAPAATGALVLGELCGTPAATVGLNPGDVITSVNGQPVTTPSSLTSIMQGLKSGSRVAVTWVSVASGHKVTRSLTLSPAPPK